jgi:hypothetical protein
MVAGRVGADGQADALRERRPPGPSRPAVVGLGWKTLAAGPSSSRRRSNGRKGAECGSGAAGKRRSRSAGSGVERPRPRPRSGATRSRRASAAQGDCGRSRPGSAATERTGGGTDARSDLEDGRAPPSAGGQLGRSPGRVSVAGVVAGGQLGARAGRDRGRCGEHRNRCGGICPGRALRTLRSPPLTILVEACW